MVNSFAFMIPVTWETKSKSRVSFTLDITLAKCKVIRSYVMDYEFATKSVKACQVRRLVFAQHHISVRFALG